MTTAAIDRLDAFRSRLGIAGTITSAAFAAEPREPRNHALVARERMDRTREEYTLCVRGDHTRLGTSERAAQAALRRIAAR